ncbi:membrane protein [Actinoplanes italicus]|uniref:Putative ABC transport system permease protein n=1 Tax=Actinoplanes italicus TaxID=113567 RepID=A0A2T0JLH7_9ACTN|nr:FtsX-like permease family protein [Actinoplanes italicus]PRX08431.1 putative ABC transport system permease protein [Actinoplanes italicus]GIE36685.1 membrane protein [Actinoplanes italicus]
MLSLAAQMLRHRLGSAAATLLALTTGVTILMSLGVLVESGMRFEAEPQRFAATDVVVAHRDITLTATTMGGQETVTVPLPEGGTIPASMIDRVKQVPGVATVIGDTSVPAILPEGAATSHGWSSAALTPYRLTTGTAPQRDDEVVLDERLTGVAAVGSRVPILVDGTARMYEVSGLARSAGPKLRTGSAPVAFFTDGHAAAVFPRQGQVDAIGIIAKPGASITTLEADVRRLFGDTDIRVYAGADRGLLEQSAEQLAATMLVQLSGVFGGYVALLVMFVVAGTIGLAVRHRRRDLALLRAIAATPGQVVWLILAEVGLLSLVSVAIGLPSGWFLTRRLRQELVDRTFIPDTFPLTGGALAAVAVAVATTLVAVGAALLAARRTVRIRPTEALGEIAVESRSNGRLRLVLGLVALGAGVFLTTLTTTAKGTAALGSAMGLLFVLVIAVALLAPWINRAAARALTPVLRTVWGNSGYLAAANLRANAQGMVTVLTALVLAVGFGGSVWFLQDNLELQTVTQTREGMLAQYSMVSATGLPDSALTEIRKVPGVEAATGIRTTSMIIKGSEGATGLGAQAISPEGADRTMDLKVHSGSLADLRGPAVAVSTLQAESNNWKVGQQVNVWLGDGSPTTLRLVAIYDRGIGFGDVTVAKDVVRGHTAASGYDRILVRAEPGADLMPSLSTITETYPGSAVTRTSEVSGKIAEDLALSAWLNKLLIGIMVGYAALAAANIMVMAALARSRELALLRLVGVTTKQVKRMVHAEQTGLLGVSLLIGGVIAAITLTSVVRTLTGQSTPYVPPMGWVAIIGGTTLLALFTTILPIARLLRVPPVTGIGVKE